MAEVRMGADERRALVVKAAVTEFARSGYAGTSTEAIAKRAGISQPYVFRLFATKKDLFIAVVVSCYARVYRAFEAAAEGKASWEALQAMAEAYTRLLNDRELLLTQLHAYAACDDPEIREASRAGYRRLYELVERATGVSDEELVKFFAYGMLINVAAAMDLPHVEQPWASTIVQHALPGLVLDWPDRTPSA